MPQNNSWIGMLAFLAVPILIIRGKKRNDASVGTPNSSPRGHKAQISSKGAKGVIVGTADVEISIGSGEKMVFGADGKNEIPRQKFTVKREIEDKENVINRNDNEVRKRFVPKENKDLRKIQFAAGCFWSVELAFQRVRGVFSTSAGYTQGKVANPSYDDVKTGKSGHVETVEVTYNPSLVKLEELLETFWWKHDATSKNKQGNDKGTQYRSGIYWFTADQQVVIEKSVEEQKAKLEKPWHKIHTEVKKAVEFYRAEDYHQQYLEKGGRHGKKQSAAFGCTDPIRCYG